MINDEVVDSQIQEINQFFDYGHLPEKLQEVSRKFHSLSTDLVNSSPWNHELVVSLRKLLEAKDAAVRALIAK